MADDANDLGTKPLRLAHSQSAADIRRRSAMDTAASQEFLAGSFRALLDDRAYVLEHCLHVDGIEDGDLDGKVRAASDAIRVVLRKEYARLRTAHIPVDRVAEIGVRLGINAGLIDFMEGTDAPELPIQNIRQHLTELSDAIWHACDFVCNLQRMDGEMRPLGVNTQGLDVSRLVLYEMNANRLVPEVLVIPNWHHRYNPLLALTEPDVALPAHVARTLRLFDR